MLVAQEERGQEPSLIYTDVNWGSVMESPITLSCNLLAGVQCRYLPWRAGRMPPNPVLDTGSAPLCQRPQYATIPFVVKIVLLQPLSA